MMTKDDIKEVAMLKKSQEKNKQKIKLPNVRKMMREYEKEQKQILKEKQPIIEEATIKAKKEFVIILKTIMEISRKFSFNVFKYDDAKKDIHVRKTPSGDLIGIINNMYFRAIKDGKMIRVETYMARRLPVILKMDQPIEERRMYYKSIGIIENGEIKKLALNVESFVDIYHSSYNNKYDQGVQFYTKEYRDIKDNLIYYLYDKFSLKTIPFDQREIIPQTKYIKPETKNKR